MKRIFGCLSVLMAMVACAVAVELPDALDAPSLVWETGGDAAWFGQTDFTHDGVDAANVVVGSVDGWLQTTITGPSTISFWWFMDAYNAYGRCSFFLDDIELKEVRGSDYGDWQKGGVVIPAGVHTVKWVAQTLSLYSGGCGVSGFFNCFLDQVVIGAPLITRAPQDTVVARGGAVTLTVVAACEPLTYQWFEGTSGDASLPIMDATNSWLELPNVTADKTYWVRVSNAVGTSDSQAARILVGFEVRTTEDLQKIGSGVDGWTMDAGYLLMNNVDAAETATWNDAGTDESVLEGFKPIGHSSYSWYDPVTEQWLDVSEAPFFGVFDGQGHVIRGLTVKRELMDGVGLFGNLGADALVQNVGLVGITVTGSESVGSLVGRSEGRVFRCFVTSGEVAGLWDTGGLVGRLDVGGKIAHCYTVATVSGEETVGGLAGSNRGEIRNSYAISQVKAAYGDDSCGGLLGSLSYWGSVEASYWDEAVSGLTFSAGGEGKTSEEMRHQATYAGWDFDATWGIQEGEGAPYLRLFAESQDAHEAAPVTVYPANLSFVWRLRPAVTASVALAEGDYVKAHWQLATVEDFSDAHEWLGLADDGDPLRAPFSSRVPPECALNYGMLYYWRVRLQTAYGIWSGWSAPALFLVWTPLDPVTAAKDELSVWGEGLSSSVWQPAYLLDAHSDLSAAISKSSTNYEARIYRALTTVAMLSEDSELRGLLADFGFTFDEGLFAFTGRFAEAASPLPNDAVDRLVNQSLPAIAQAAADLAVIPADWTGMVTLSPADFPVDEEVCVDLGDVLLARAALAGARAAAETAHAYDLTLDYGKTNVSRATPVTPTLSVTLDGDASEWTDTLAVLFGDKAELEYAKLARSATQVYLLARLADGMTPLGLQATIDIAGNSYGAIWFDGLTEGVPADDDVLGLATAYYAGNVIEIVYDLPPEAHGQDVHLDNIGVMVPSPLPLPAPELAVTVDGDVSEWGAVPEAPLAGQRNLIGSVKIARDGTNFCALVTLQSGVFDSSLYFGLSVKDFLGNGFSCSDSRATFVTHGNVMEITCPIPDSCQAEPLLLDYLAVEQPTTPEGWWVYDYLWFNWTHWDEASRVEKKQPLNQFLDDHPLCLSTVRNPGKLPSAKASLREALTLAIAADAAITGRTDGVMHFFEYDPVHSNEQAEARQRLNETLASMDAPQHVAYGGREEKVHLGAFFDSPFITRTILPRLTDDDEIVVGTFPSPTLNGILTDMTQTSWEDELLGFAPLVKENAFAIDGQSFTTGGYTFWEVAEGSGLHTNVAQSGQNTNACVSWVETTLTGPGTLNFSWAVSSTETVNLLSVLVDGVRQVGSLLGENGWGPRQLVLAGGVHRVRWVYVRNKDGGLDEDGGLIDNLVWAANATGSTDTPVRVPYLWLAGFAGLVEGEDYNAAAWDDQDGDGKTTWEEFVMGTTPTNAASVFLTTIGKQGPSLEVGWTPDLGPSRVYTVEGKARLSDSEWAQTNSASRFFRVKVQMP